MPQRIVDPRHFGLDEDDALLPLANALEVRRGRSLARQDLKKLLALDREGRRARIEDAESRRSFRSRALAELLLEESRRRIGGDPDEAAHLAGLAQRVLHWTPGPPGERWRETVRARATAHQANALRRADRLDEAERRFDRLHRSLLRHHLGSPRLLAEAAQWEAALRWRQGREGEASELLGRAADAHRRAGSRRGMARCLLRWSDLLRSVGEPGAAAGVLAWAARVVEPAAWAAERRRVLLRLGQALCDAGREEEARQHLAAVTPECGDGEDDPWFADRTWLAGRVEASPRRLTAARDALASAGRPGEAALASLDGVALLLPRGAAGPRGKAGRGLRELAVAEGLAARVREWILVAAGHLDALPATGAASPPAGAEPADAESADTAASAMPSSESATALDTLRRGLLREVSLASWTAD